MNESVPPIGGLTDRVQLLRNIAGDLEPVATMWGRVQAVGNRQFVVGEVMTHTVIIRHRADLAPGDRFVFRGRNLDVLSAEDLTGRRAFLACRCREDSSNGN